MRPLNRMSGQVPGVGQHFHKGEIIAGRDAVESRRWRILIGGGGEMQIAQPKMEYDMTQPYAGQTWVHVGPLNNAVVLGTIDPDSSLHVYSIPGWYCSRPSGVPIAAGPGYHIPQVPLPNTSGADYIDNPQNYWVIFDPEPQCY